MDITTYGNPVLRRKADPVKEITPALRELAQEMLRTMYAADGVGLAAEQVGRTEALCVIDVPPDAQGARFAEMNAAVKQPMILFNPVVSDPEGTQRGNEGCLSFPEISGPVTRALSCTVSYTGEDGKSYAVRVHGLLARAVQHEVDHLNGVLFVDKFSSAQKMLAAGKLRRLQRRTAEALGAGKAAGSR